MPMKFNKPGVVAAFAALAITTFNPIHAKLGG